MLRCEHCGALLRQEWDYCSRCGADLPQPADFDDQDDTEGRVRGALHSARSSLGSMRPAYPSGAASAAGSALSAPGTWVSRLRSRRSGSRGPSAALLLGIVVVVLGIALAVAWWSALDAREQLSTAQAQQGQVQAESSRLAAELEASRTALAGLEAEAAETAALLEEVQGQLAGGEEELGTLTGEFVELRQQLSAVQSDLDEAVGVIEDRDESIASQEAAIAVLSDCLAGMQVALAFARAGQMESADRAYMTISETCDRARELL